jgi:uncharacterized tellurite resistance protein B-like protein
MTFDKLLLQTAFICMACDGKIAPVEIALIKSICDKEPVFQNMDFNVEIEKFVTDINAGGKQFIANCLQLLEETNLTEQEELDLIDIAIRVIKADNVVEYSEIKFFKTIRYRLKISDDAVIAYFSSTIEDIDLFLGEDIRTNTSLEDITQQYFDLVELPKFEEIKIKIIV